MTKETLKDILKFLKKRGFQKGAIAKELAITPGYLSDILAGRKPMSPDFEESFKKEYKPYIAAFYEAVSQGMEGGINNGFTVMNKENPAESEDSYRVKYIDRLENDIEKLEKDKAVLQELIKANQEIIRTNLTLVLSTVRTISGRQEANGGVSLESLARLEKKEENALVLEADRRTDQIEREAHEHGNASAMSM